MKERLLFYGQLFILNICFYLTGFHELKITKRHRDEKIDRRHHITKLVHHAGKEVIGSS
jgi:hypothetical protein